MEWVEWIENLNVRGFCAQGIVSADGSTPISTAWFPAADCPLTISGSPAAPASSSPCASSAICSGLFLDALEKAHADGRLRFFGAWESLRDPHAFTRYLAPLRETQWVVYAKPPFGGPQQVLEYLGRYTHRVAISNQRLMALENGQVSFRWKDYRHPQRPKVMTLSAEEFIRRFLLHAVPRGFQRIRYYGFLANCHRVDKLHFCRRCLAVPGSDLLPSPMVYHEFREFYARLTGRNLKRCPQCGIGTMIQIEILFSCHGPIPLRVDTS